MNKHRSIFAVFLALAISSGAYGGGYKWVEKDGSTHFSDTIPPEYIKEKYEEISKFGMVTTTHERVKTEEEIAEKNIQDEYDRILLATYLTEKDLEYTKDRRITIIEGTIRLAESNIDMLNQMVNRLKKEAVENTDNQKILEQLETAKVKLFDYENFISRKNKEQNDIRTTFDQELERFRTLKGRP